VRYETAAEAVANRAETFKHVSVGKVQYRVVVDKQNRVRGYARLTYHPLSVRLSHCLVRNNITIE